MQSILSKEQPILPSLCDSDASLSFSSIGALFMDIAMLHAETLGMGFTGFSQKGLFWVATKSRIKIIKDARMAESTTINTWPEEAGVLRCNRNYEIVRDGEVIAQGKTEWAIVDAASHVPQKTKGLFPEELVISDKVGIKEPFLRLKGDFDGDFMGEYTIRSVDIDYGDHMNNVAYIRAIEGLFSAGEIRERGFREFEIHYKNPCFEGCVLSFYCVEKDGRLEIKALDEEGQIAVLAAFS